METKTSRRKIYHYFTGIDVSKRKLDFAILNGQAKILHKKIDNTPESITEFLADMQNLNGLKISKMIFCLEHTGFYANHILGTLKRLKACVVVENPLKIKNSMGIIRGKSDKMDAIRIAQFVKKNKDELRPWVPRRPVLLQLKNLICVRERLLAVSVMLKTPLKEQVEYIHKGIHHQSLLFCRKSMSSVDADLVKVNLAIRKLVRNDKRLTWLYQLITSVPGVGPVCAHQIILSTNEFLDIINPKKFACYAGVAPFKKESGQSIGKARVSHISNKKMKKLLHIAALRAIRWDEEIQTYYKRKTEMEGKPKMAVINAIRNKIILRVFACLNQNRSFIKSYERPAIGGNNPSG